MRNLFLTMQRTGTVVIIVLTSLIVAGYGMLALWKPELVWKLEHLGRRWMYQDPEPTESALMWTRIAGACSIIASMFFLLFMLWKVAGR